MSATPIHDTLKADWSAAIASAEARASIELRNHVLATLKRIVKPTLIVKKLIEELESNSWKQ